MERSNRRSRSRSHNREKKQKTRSPSPVKPMIDEKRIETMENYFRTFVGPELEQFRRVAHTQWETSCSHIVQIQELVTTVRGLSSRIIELELENVLRDERDAKRLDSDNFPNPMNGSSWIKAVEGSSSLTFNCVLCDSLHTRQVAMRYKTTRYFACQACFNTKRLTLNEKIRELNQIAMRPAYTKPPTDPRKRKAKEVSESL